MSRTSEAPQMVGKFYGGLLVVDVAPSVRRPDMSGTDTRLVCVCLCGAERIVTSRNLKSGNTRSCGCKIHRRMREDRKAS